jgi:hypothetical protein
MFFPFPCGSCGRTLAVTKRQAGALTRCPHCLRWMFAPHAPLCDRELERTQAGVDTVVEHLPALRRPPAEPAADPDPRPHPAGADLPAAAREAATLLSTAAALRQVGRLADAAAAAEQARHRMTETVRAVDLMLADLHAAVARVQLFVDPSPLAAGVAS